MKDRGNPRVRVWEEVYTIYAEVARRHGIAISDLVSIVLLYTPIFSPVVIAVGVKDNYDVDEEEAFLIAREVSEAMERMIGSEVEVHAEA